MNMNDSQDSERDRVDDAYATTSKADSNGMTGCAMGMIGFGIFTLVMLAITAAGVYWAYQNVRSVTANIVTPAIDQIVEQMQIPADQKKQISARIDKLATSYKNNEIDLKQLEVILKDIGDSPITAAAGAIWFTVEYLSKSGLTDPEKAQATMTTRRFAKGLLNNDFNEHQADEVMNLIADRLPDGTTDPKKPLTDTELKDILSKMKVAADKAGIAADVPEIDFASQFDRIVDKALSSSAKSD